MLLNDFIVKTLENIGCEAVFYVPGGGIPFDRRYKSTQLKLVPPFHEQASTIAQHAVTGKSVSFW